ncbi:N-6 DNA methylase [Rhodococcus sp. NPDC059968]|uniref:N-6 DNA methylase n=1 Tax=Rhodococcus sp. NPDC059968 TaxID=3347017 RepID=UPI00366C4136
MTTSATDTISTVAISEILGVTRGTITNWKSRKDDFPEPVAGTPRSPLYDRQEIFRWLIANGKATEKQLRGIGVEKIVAQLLDMLRNQGLHADVLSAAVCYAHLSRAEILPEACRWTSGVYGTELSDAIEAANVWTRSSPVTDTLPILTPLLMTRRQDIDIVERVLRQIDTVENLQSMHDALVDAARSEHSWEATLPTDLAAMVAELLPEAAKSIFDPYCTSGSLIATCGLHRPEADLTVASPYDSSLESTMRWTLTAGLRLTALGGDVIAGDMPTNLRADAVVCNAPLGRKLNNEHQRIYDTDPRWMFGTPRGDMHWAVLQDAIFRLNPGGRALLLCAKSVLFNTMGGAGAIRESLIRQSCIEAVIALPPGVVRNTGVGLCLLVLARPGEVRDPENVLLIDLAKPERRSDRPDFSTAVRTYRRWLATATVDTDADYAFSAPVREILSPQGSLDPSKWREAANRPEVDDLVQALHQAQTNLEKALSGITTTIDTDWAPQTGLASRHTTIGLLSAIQIHRGASLDRRVLDADPETGVPVLSLQALNGRATDEDIRYVDPDTVRGNITLTQPGDVVAHSTPSGVVAKVWNEAGWLPNSHAEILRVVDAAEFDPEFLALCLTSRLITEPVTVGSIVPRVQSKNVTIPLIPIIDQRSVVAYLKQIDKIAAYGQGIARSAAYLQRVLADAAASGIAMARA